MKKQLFYVKEDRVLLGSSLLGVQGEHRADLVRILLPKMWGDVDLSAAEFRLAFHNPTDYFEEIAPEERNIGENIELIFPVTRTMTAIAGEATIQLIARIENEVVFKSETAKVCVVDSAIDPDEISVPYPEELTDIRNQIDTKADKREVDVMVSALADGLDTKADASQTSEQIQTVTDLANSKVDKLAFDSAITALLEKTDQKIDRDEAAAELADVMTIISGKADKIANPAGNIAGVDEVGNLCSSGYSLEELDGGVFRLSKNSTPVITFRSKPLDITSWDDVKSIVRAGLARDYFSIGDRLYCEKDGKTLAWDVIGIDHDTPSNPDFKHSMTLALSDIYRKMQADVSQALFVCEQDYPAGEFFVKKDGYTYSFITQNDLKTGYMIAMTQNLDKANIYQNNRFDSLLESVETEATVNGVLWGEMEGTSVELTPHNEFPYTVSGSCDYLTSAIRQWLNSSKTDWWTPSTKYSRRHYQANSAAGFLNGMDEDFLNAVGYVKKKTRVPTELPDSEVKETDERFFLLSSSEVSAQSNTEEGEQYPFFVDSESRKRSFEGAISRWRLRTGRIDMGNSFKDIDTNGNVNHGTADNSDGVIAACCIV